MTAEEKFLQKYIEPGIRRTVALLRANGFCTFSSCEGGKGHLFERPTIRLYADSGRTAAQTRRRLFKVLHSANYILYVIKEVWHWPVAIDNVIQKAPSVQYLELEIFVSEEEAMKRR